MSVSTSTRMLPIPIKYTTIDGRYRFSKRSDACTLLQYYPIVDCLRTWHYRIRRVNRRKRHIVASQLQLDTTKGIYDGNKFPDVVLQCIFKYLHPLDLINGCSKVCKRWNVLVRTPSLYREVRIVVDLESFHNGSVRQFLKAVSNHVKKLCVVHSSLFTSLNELHTIFPECMPNVMLLDIGSFDGLPLELIEKLVKCFPNVEILNIATVAVQSKTKNEQLSTLFVDAAFPRLRRLIIGYVDIFDMRTTHALLSWKRSLEVLVFHNAATPSYTLGPNDLPHSQRGSEIGWLKQHLQARCCDQLSQIDAGKFGRSRLHCVEMKPFLTTLKELHLDLVNIVDVTAICNFKNLVTLSLGCCWQMADEHLIFLKELYKIEHLHFSTLGNGVSAVGLANFLRLPEHSIERYFPHRLKYLRISYCEQFTLEVVEELVKSCPDLESLNIAGNSMLGEGALSLLIAKLRKLRFADLSYLSDSENELSVLQNLADDELSCLRFLQMHNKQESIEIALRTLNLKRPNMLISSRRDYLINWDIVNGRIVFNERFNGDLNAIINDLNDEPGFCCIDGHNALCGRG